MKTIEQCEAEIASKSEIIRSQLERFQQNIGRIGSIIGKDSTLVYETLTARYNDVMDVYSTMTRRNVEILTGYIDTLDSIMIVLQEIMLAIDKIEQSNEDLTVRLEVNDALEKANELATAIATEAEQAVEKATGTDLPSKTFKQGLIGTGAYLALKALGMGRLASAAGAVATAWLSTKGE